MNKIIAKKVFAILIYTIISITNNYSNTFAKEAWHLVNTGNFFKEIPEHSLQTVKLNFELKNQGYVKLAIYNSNKEIVETIVDGEMEKGEYNVFFKSTKRIESGSYYYKITFNGELILKKPIIF